jgi:hypothetical protein
MASSLDKATFIDGESNEKTLLLFTGGKGEPKCVDVDRCLDELGSAAVLTPIGDSTDQQDFLDACPRVPLSPITFYFANDPSRLYSSFSDSRGVQFSYQAIYKKGFLSAPAPYSNVAVPPAILSAGNKPLGEVTVENTCVLEIPRQSNEVEAIRLIVREGNEGVARRIDDIYLNSSSQNFTIDATGTSPYVGFYTFYNDVRGSVMSETDRLKTFDAVPRNAKAQEVAGDRVIYGNYTDGYSNIQTDTTLSVSFAEAPPPGYAFDIKAIPALFRHRTKRYSDQNSTTLMAGTDTTADAYRYQTNAGFLLDDKLVPDTVGAGIYEINIQLSPLKNFHQFLGETDSPNSMESVYRDVDIAGPYYTDFQDTVPDINVNPTNDVGITPSPVGTVDGVYSIRQKVRSRDFAIPNIVNTGAGGDIGQYCKGVNVSLDGQSENTVTWTSSTGTKNVTLGKTCRSPLIFQGGNLNFSATITVTGDTTKEIFMKSLVHALWGLDPTTNPIAVAGLGTQDYPLTDDEWFATHTFNKGLNDGDIFSHENSELSDLIVSIQESGSVNPAPLAYGIVNSATMQFCLEPAKGNTSGGVPDYFGEDSDNLGKFRLEEENGDVRSLYGIKLSLANIRDFDFKTCIPNPKAGFGSLLAPNAADNIVGNFDNFSDAADREKAMLYQTRATSLWDYDVTADGTAIKLAWPSIERNLSIPSVANSNGYVTDAAAYGPAKQNGSVDPEWQFVNETTVPFVFDDNGTPFPAAGTITAPTIANAGVFKQRQTLWSDYIAENEGEPVAWMPAPISEWYVFDSPAGITNANWKDNFGYKADMTTEPNFTFNGTTTNKQITGSPATLIRGVSEHWAGAFNSGTLTQTISTVQYCKFGLYRTTRPSTGTVSTHQSNCPYSLIDGDMGPGGAFNAGTRNLGERGDGLSDGWGFPLSMGTHDGSFVDSNVVGRNANVKGSVTAFSLVGWTDNFPGYILQNVSRNTPLDGVAPASQLRDLAVSCREFNHPFRNHPPRYFDATNRGTSIAYIKESKGPILNYSDELLRVTTTTLGINSAFLGYLSATDYRSFMFPGGTGFPKNVVIPFSGATNGSAMIQNIVQSNTDSAALGGKSFKTKASHEFGIVYYDKKGRHGAVQPIGSVYVPGYDSERSIGLYGSVAVRLEINHAPPEWAEHYRIVYAGNTSVEEFFQYTIANAFVSPDQAQADKIYLSLAHLQSSPIAYTNAYGAVSQQDGSERIYRFAPGDKLRIISYSDTSGEPVYLSKSFEYKILGVENLIPSMDDHPLFSEEQEEVGTPETDNRRNGEFLVIENNSDNVNFASGSVSTGSSFWTHRCLVELYRPKLPLGEDAPYYETNYGGLVVTAANGQKTHQYNTIVMRRGDVYFRAVPMNVQKIINSNFESLISGSSTNDTSESNFTPYFVETEGFTDSFISNTHDYGRIHFIDRDASEADRKYSLTFSEQTSLGSFQPRWLSFPSIGNFKDYSFEFGEIDAIDFDGQFLNSFHENRVLKIPFQRNILSTGETDQVVSSTKVLGTELAIPIESGTSGHPESVIKIDGDYFFFDASKKRIVMLKGGKSPQVITDLGVRSYFKKKVDQWINSGGYKASMGYDPKNEELLISLSNAGDFAVSSFPSTIGDAGRMNTMSFDLLSKKNWKTRYSFASPIMAQLGENLVSFHKGSEGIVQPWIHDDTAGKNSFYGQSYNSELSCAFGGDPNQIKEFESVIVDAEYPWAAAVKSGNESTSIPSDRFKRYNDRLYGIIDGVSVPNLSQLKTNRPASIPTFPKNQYRGDWISKIPEIKLENNVVQIKMFMPSSHPMFKAPFAIGKNSLLYEKKADGLLTPLGSDPRNYQVGQLSGYRIMDVKKSTTPGENITELIVEMTNSSLAIAALVAINDSNFPATGFEFTNIADLEGGAAAGSAEFFGITVLPLLSFYFNTWDVTNYQDYIDSTSYNPASAALVYDLNDDGSVNITDILTFLSSFGAGFDTADLLAILTEFGSESLPGEYGTVTPEQADLLAWQALISGGGQNKNIYSLFTTVKEPLIGRNVELTMTSSPSDPNSELFSIEVGFNSRNKSMSNASAARQPKKK